MTDEEKRKTRRGYSAAFRARRTDAIRGRRKRCRAQDRECRRARTEELRESRRRRRRRAKRAPVLPALAALAAALALASCASPGASADAMRATDAESAADVTRGGVRYTLQADGAAPARGYTAAGPAEDTLRELITEVRIASVINGLPVAAVGSEFTAQSDGSVKGAVFAGCMSLSRVVIPEGVASIGSWAFSDCASLLDIELPESVTHIGADAFEGCTRLKIAPRTP